MRLLPFGSRVKFRRRCAFRGKLPSLVQCRAPAPVSPPAKLHQYPERQRDDAPPATCQKPRGKTVTPAKALQPPALELREGKSSCFQHTLLEIMSCNEPLKQRVNRGGGIPPG